MELPKIITEQKFESFTLRALDYRKLTNEEMQQVLLRLIQQYRWKRLPKNKIFTCITSFGAFDIS